MRNEPHSGLQLANSGEPNQIIMTMSYLDTYYSQGYMLSTS